MNIYGGTLMVSKKHCDNQMSAQNSVGVSVNHTDNQRIYFTFIPPVVPRFTQRSRGYQNTSRVVFNLMPFYMTTQKLPRGCPMIVPWEAHCELVKILYVMCNCPLNWTILRYFKRVYLKNKQTIIYPQSETQMHGFYSLGVYISHRSTCNFVL